MAGSGRASAGMKSHRESFVAGLSRADSFSLAVSFAIEYLMNALGAESGSIFIAEPNGRELRLAEIRGEGREPLVGIRRGLDEGITGWVARNRQAVLVKNIEADERFAGIRNVEGHYGTESFVAMALVHNDALIGVVNLTDKTALKPFDEDDLSLLANLVEAGAPLLAEMMDRERQDSRRRTLAEKIELARRELDCATEQLSEIERFNRSVINCIPFPVIAFDRSLHARFCNPAAMELFGEYIESGSLLKLPLEPKEGIWSAELPAAIEDGRSLSFNEVTFAPDDGTRRTVKVVVSPTNEPKTGEKPVFAKTIGGLMVVEDIEEKVTLRRQLAQAERLAGIGRLAASVAHELNNPIDGMLRYLNLVQKIEPENERLERYLTECRGGLQRMARIVSSLLEYSRSNNRSRRMQTIPSMLRETLRLLQPSCARSGAEVKTNIGPGLDTPVRECFLQCFVNVVRNALDAMPEGGELVITATQEGSTAVVEFADNGPGIPPEIQERMFAPFFTTKGPEGGTGLGLAVCQDLTSQAGGRMEVDSSHGQGATFRFHIPLE